MSGAPYGIPGRRVVALRPISEDEAIVVGHGPEEGGTVRAFEVEGRPSLLYSGYRFVPIQ